MEKLAPSVLYIGGMGTADVGVDGEMVDFEIAQDKRGLAGVAGEMSVAGNDLGTTLECEWVSRFGSILSNGCRKLINFRLCCGC